MEKAGDQLSHPIASWVGYAQTAKLQIKGGKAWEVVEAENQSVKRTKTENVHCASEIILLGHEDSLASVM